VERSVISEINPKHQNLKADLKKWVLLLLFEFVGAKNLQTTPGLFCSETLIVTLEEREDIFNDDCLEVNFFLVIEVIGLKLDLCRMLNQLESYMHVMPGGERN
jgi:hypothetical protein